MKEPSEKQQRAAKMISATLGIPLPTDFTAACYWSYISQHLSASQKANAQKKEFARQWHTSKSNPRQERLRAQREADWQATHLSSDAWARGVMNGEIMPPSWSGETPLEAQRRLRGLGFKSDV